MGLVSREMAAEVGTVWPRGPLGTAHRSTGEEAQGARTGPQRRREIAEQGVGLPEGKRAGGRLRPQAMRRTAAAGPGLRCSARQVGVEGLAEGVLRNGAVGLEKLMRLGDSGPGGLCRLLPATQPPPQCSHGHLRVAARQSVSSLTAPKNRGWPILGPQEKPLPEGADERREAAHPASVPHRAGKCSWGLPSRKELREKGKEAFPCPSNPGS